MRFAFEPFFHWGCRACGRDVAVTALADRSVCPCGGTFDIAPAFWLSIAAGSVEFDAGTLPCPGCDAALDLDGPPKPKPKALGCGSCGAKGFELRTPNAAEKTLLEALQLVAFRKGSADVLLVEAGTVRKTWTALLDSSAGYEEALCRSTSSERLDEIVATGNSVFRTGAARNPALRRETLERLAGDGDTIVRATIARRDLSSLGEISQLLALDASPRVRFALARNPTASVEAVALLADDVDARVRQAVVDRKRGGMAPVLGAGELPVPNDRSVAQDPPTREELGVTSDEDYNRLMTEIYRH